MIVNNAGLLRKSSDGETRLYFSRLVNTGTVDLAADTLRPEFSTLDTLDGTFGTSGGAVDQSATPTLLGTFRGDNYNFNSGSLNSTFTIAGALNGTPGTSSNFVTASGPPSPASLIIAPGGRLNIGGGGFKGLTDYAIHNGGLVRWNGTRLLEEGSGDSGATINNFAGATFEILSDADMVASYNSERGGKTRPAAATTTKQISTDTAVRR